jgi:two-component system response regulator RegA
MTKQVHSESGRLLLVDDDVTFCAVFQRALLRHGFSVTVAHDTHEALEAADRFQPTHAVVDLKLANESGLHLIKPLLSLNDRMKIIVLTGYGSISTAVKAIKAGAGNYLAKPVDVAAVLSAFDSTEEQPAEETGPTPMSLGRLEWEHIQRVLDEHDGNISATARSLGMHRRTLQRKLRKRPAKE